ncbi:MAG TPA: carbohydrate kinase family protein, partial [Magnetospirillaceae bacterium]|nr:carbohydrate kinase family protein [Magnetospirillaceae bacterium]
AYVVADKKRVVCFGGAVMDRKYHALKTLVAGTSNPATSVRAYGGVARNVAENLARLDIAVSMISAVGDDESGRGLMRALQLLGVDVSGISISAAHGTAEYAAILQPDNELAFGIADMAVFETLSTDKLNTDWPLLASADWVFADCNVPADTLQALISRAAGSRFKLAIDAVSVHKVTRLPSDLSAVSLLFLNRDEAAALGTARGARAVVTTLGQDGVLLSDQDGARPLPAPVANVRDVTGAGDSLVAGTLFGLQQGRALAEAVKLGLLLAKLTVETDGSVRQDLTPDLLKESS